MAETELDSRKSNVASVGVVDSDGSRGSVASAGDDVSLAKEEGLSEIKDFDESLKTVEATLRGS